MSEFNTIEEVYREIEKKFDNLKKKKVISLYAFNGIGKTSISKSFDELNDNEKNQRKSLVYNAFFEDHFYWDNNNLILRLGNNLNFVNNLMDELNKTNSQDYNSVITEISMNKSTWIGEFFSEENNFKEVLEYFNYLTALNLEIVEVEEYGENKKMNVITGFKFIKSISNNDEQSTPIKISRGEESLFIWSVFYIILKTSIRKFEDKEQDSSDFTKYLTYVVIDDPVSSLDDNNLISIAIDLISLIKEYQKKIKDDKEKKENLNFLISTHHPLFYNLIKNSKIINDNNNNNLILNKKEKISEVNGSEVKEEVFKLNESKKYSFGYHLFLMSELNEVINSEDKDIRKYHFNMFRNIVEKTSNYLGYENLENCIRIDKKDIIKKYIHNYSHSTVSDLEYSEVNEESKQLLKEAFNQFIKDYKFNIKNE